MAKKIYNAGREISSYQPLTIDEIETLPIFQSISEDYNSEILKKTIREKIFYINSLFDRVLKINNDIVRKRNILIRDAMYIPNSRNLYSKPVIEFEYMFTVEDLVHNIKKTTDFLIYTTFLLTISEDYNKQTEMYIEDIDSLVRCSDDNVVKQIILCGSSNYQKDITEFLLTINELDNNYLPVSLDFEISTLLSSDYPVFFSYSQKNDKFREKRTSTVLHKHNGFQIMMGFHDTFNRIRKNQIIFIKNRTDGRYKVKT